MRRPSPALVISTAALFVALSGTAYAATGGTFILGKSNTASKVSGLANTTGSALRLSAPASSAPLIVSNSVQVQKLNASLLGGIPASGFVQGTATIHSANITIPDGSSTGLGPVGNLGGLFARCAFGSAANAEVTFSANNNDSSAVQVGGIAISSGVTANLGNVVSPGLQANFGDSSSEYASVQLALGTEVDSAALSFSRGGGACVFMLQMIDSD